MQEANKEFELLCAINGLNKARPITLGSGEIVYRDTRTSLAWRFFLKGWKCREKAKRVA